MATVYQERTVLVEIPAPQPVIQYHTRRSYWDALSYRGKPPDSHRINRAAASLILDSLLFKSTRCHKDKVGLQLQFDSLDVLNSMISMMSTEDQRKHIPLSYLKIIEEEMHFKKMNVYRSIPYSRLNSNRDAYCYRKACPHLLAFKKTCLKAGNLLIRSQQWEAVLDYVLIAWRYTSELPQWDTRSHNQYKEQCFRALAFHCIKALQECSIDLERCVQLQTRFKIARGHSKFITPCIEELEKIIKQHHSTSTESVL
ncbi:uncharacterized protein LOC114650347 isoform X1 [Erpetoichthys calabaricus]|uniref:uncharacterized protein LOC114650347 isoform X1 n=1 Tax=Erpetoichthys calabaricus TaxID=27687 RepID=UPI0010A01C44|nr:uncharacterized protein LOC114650347 isoform X1 [Erpetoichthys calabaricus]XP_051782045.1 uncharacterized protein LOC114650347 isoform X1 [Erpetoichthys calabaricus]